MIASSQVSEYEWKLINDGFIFYRSYAFKCGKKENKDIVFTIINRYAKSNRNELVFEKRVNLSERTRKTD